MVQSTSSAATPPATPNWSSPILVRRIAVAAGLGCPGRAALALPPHPEESRVHRTKITEITPHPRPHPQAAGRRGRRRRRHGARTGRARRPGRARGAGRGRGHRGVQQHRQRLVLDGHLRRQERHRRRGERLDPGVRPAGRRDDHRRDVRHLDRQRLACRGLPRLLQLHDPGGRFDVPLQLHLHRVGADGHPDGLPGQRRQVRRQPRGAAARADRCHRRGRHRPHGDPALDGRGRRRLPRGLLRRAARRGRRGIERDHVGDRPGPVARDGLPVHGQGEGLPRQHR
ncbi:hypothetical protein SBRY_10918 [Actinacidiphila bryophytorum]|uniref:Uncharacterized protein n=1 Tax=Actinacidiphila bryophytorum TaxID=1436133 RepID=A0A9W4E300_9ACTN|nr:hypothetical protein SBRY_10918 [Actinacidiphila bryophytorum]